MDRSAHDNPTPAKSSFWPKLATAPGNDASYDALPCSIAPLREDSALLTHTKLTPCGPVSGPTELKHCSCVPDLISRRLEQFFTNEPQGLWGI